MKKKHLVIVIGVAIAVMTPVKVSAQAWTGFVPGRARRQTIESQIGPAPNSCSTPMGKAEKYRGAAGATELWIVYDEADVVSFVQAIPSGEFTDSDAKRNWGSLTVGLNAEGSHHRTHYPQGRAVVAYNAAGGATRIVLGASLDQKSESSGGLGSMIGSLLKDAAGLNTAAAVGELVCY